MPDGASQKTLLIIDDDEELLRSLVFGLSPDRWHCLPCPSWNIAFQQIVAGIKPAAAIVDLHLIHDLPLTGFDVIRKLAGRFPDLPIVALTGHPDYAGAAQRCIDAGAIQFVRKPVEIAELGERLDQAAWIHQRHRKALEAEQAERRAAASIQKALFPNRSPCVTGFDIQQDWLPAVEVTGDYCDCVSFPRSQQVLLAVGDAKGHGLSAALNAHVVGGAWRALTSTEGEAPDPAQMLGLINEIVFRGAAEEAAMTLLILRLDVEAGRVFYANAGHPYPIVFRGAETRELTESGLMLGIDPGSVYRNGRFYLQEGDLLVLYSDGLTDVELPAQAGQTALLGREGLVREVRKLLKEGGTHYLPSRLLRQLRVETGKEHFDDDCTVVTIEATRSTEAPFASALEAERQSFEATLPELMRTHRGLFVAVRDGQVVDQDSDELELVRRMQRAYPGTFVLVRRVGEAEPDETF